jgi:hypothetical protein
MSQKKQAGIITRADNWICRAARRLAEPGDHSIDPLLEMRHVINSTGQIRRFSRLECSEVVSESAVRRLLGVAEFLFRERL